MKTKKVKSLVKLDKSRIPKHVPLKRIKSRQKRCFELALKFVWFNEDWDLVHAILTMPFEHILYLHAFTQKDNAVYDPVSNTFYDKSSYYKYNNVKDIRIYNLHERNKFFIETKNFGPWDESLFQEFVAIVENAQKRARYTANRKSD